MIIEDDFDINECECCGEPKKNWARIVCKQCAIEFDLHMNRPDYEQTTWSLLSDGQKDLVIKRCYLVWKGQIGGKKI